ncbi:MAG TPA: hypothetical protein VHX87_06730, partial [Galbitalea sp.]|nr:hypothetical protein [Galbitalea sp.]
DSGREQAAAAVYPIVVWLIADPNRRSALRAAMSADKHIDHRIFEIHDNGAFIRRAIGVPTLTSTTTKGGEQ